MSESAVDATEHSPAPKHCDLLLSGGCVVTLDGDFKVIPDGAVAIRDGAIVAVGSSQEVGRGWVASRTLGIQGRLVMPGLVDLHAHSGGGLLKTIGEHLDGAGWREMNARVFQQFTDPEWWFVEGQLHALERLRFGTTAIFTMNGGSGTRTDDGRYLEASAKAFESVGIRATIGLAPARPPWPQPFSTWTEGAATTRMVEFDEVLATCREVLEAALRNPKRLITYSAALSRLGNQNPHDPVWTEEHGRWVGRQASAMRELMEGFGIGFWTHVYGEALEFAQDNDLGLLGPKTILSHATGITQKGMEIIAQSGSHVAHSPRARRLYTYGADCPVAELVDMGVNVALGSDGPPPDRPSDIFLDMKMAMALQRRRFQDSHVIPAGLALAMASRNGYRALGLSEIGGSLEVGKRADVVVIDTRKPHLVPQHMPVHQLVYSATGRDVDTVIVDGSVIIENGRVLSVDEQSLLAQADELARKTVRDAGLRSHLEVPEGFWTRSRA